MSSLSSLRVGPTLSVDVDESVPQRKSQYPLLRPRGHISKIMAATPAAEEAKKKTGVEDFEFGKVLGEGSYGDVRKMLTFMPSVDNCNAILCSLA